MKIGIVFSIMTVFSVEGVIRAPLLRDPNQGDLLEVVRRKGQYLSRKFDKRDDDYDADLYNDQGSQYLVTVSVGTPPQDFTVTLDTGSADLWIPSTQCPATNCPFTRFDPAKSSTLKSLNKKFGIQYGIGGVNGTYVTDTVSVGGATVKDQQLGLAYITQDILLPSASKDPNAIVGNGILGLGYPSLTQANSQGLGPYNPFVFNLVQNKIIREPVFSIFLNSISQPGWSGEILFGGIDDDKYEGELKYLPVAPLTSRLNTTGNYYYWMVHGQGLGVTGSKNANPSWKLKQTGAFILDTGTTLTYFPTTIAQEIVDAIAGPKNYALDRRSGVYLVDCAVAKSSARFELQMSRSSTATDTPVVLSVPAYELVIPIDSNSSDNATVCMFGIAPLGGSGTVGSNMYLVGDSVLRSAYMVYDMGQNRIGLAANKNIGGTLTDGSNPKKDTNNSLSNNSASSGSTVHVVPYHLILALFSVASFFL